MNAWMNACANACANTCADACARYACLKERWNCFSFVHRLCWLEPESFQAIWSHWVFFVAVSTMHRVIVVVVAVAVTSSAAVQFLGVVGGNSSTEETEHDEEAEEECLTASEEDGERERAGVARRGRGGKGNAREA